MPASEPQREPTVLLAANAMRVRYELALFDGEPARLRAAGEEALDELRRVEDDLSAWNPGGDIGRLNASAAGESVSM
ncbi:MAG: hypothetical protein ACKO5K_03300, partial [Armatimonadota bacterium]